MVVQGQLGWAEPWGPRGAAGVECSLSACTWGSGDSHHSETTQKRVINTKPFIAPI